MPNPSSKRDHWLDALSDEDIAFIKRFILASGSLKQLAKEYDVSYPTVRSRINRLIDKISIYEQQHTKTEFERILLACYAEGSLNRQTVNTLLKAYQKESGHD